MYLVLLDSDGYNNFTVFHEAILLGPGQNSRFRRFPPCCVYLHLLHLKDHVLFFYPMLFHMITFFCSCLSSSALLNKSPLYCVVVDGNILHLFEVYSFQSSIMPCSKNRMRRQRLLLIFRYVLFEPSAVSLLHTQRYIKVFSK